MSDSQRVNVRPGAPDDEDEGDPRRWKILGVCLAISFLTMMTVSIINVALPSITTSLSAGSLALQAMVSGYTLAFGLALVPTGRVGDAGHRRLIILISLGVFAAASVVSALATSDIVLAVARLVQGVAAGSMSPQGMGLTQQVFSWRERGRAFGFNGAIIGVSTTLGPVIGGGIIAAVGNEYGWRWIFGMTAVFALVVLGFAWRLVPADKPATGPVSLDAGGLTLISVMALALMMPFILTNGTNDDPQRWWWLVLAAACLV
ncbi:MAG: MFS transporter, partial [Propionibacteriaceae bacterium]|nr:MFS transporter [Propionibacteriaceae bacterium]